MRFRAAAYHCLNTPIPSVKTMSLSATFIASSGNDVPLSLNPDISVFQVSALDGDYYTQTMDEALRELNPGDANCLDNELDVLNPGDAYRLTVDDRRDDPDTTDDALDE